MPSFSGSSAARIELVSFLTARRESILKNWRMACDADPLLNKVVGQRPHEFNDSLPLVLTILQQRLVGQAEEGNIAQLAIAHGLQRWYKAHRVVETVRELNHLTQALYNELAHFQELYPSTDSKLFWPVQQHMTQIMAEVINGSIQTYEERERSEAANRAAILQKALDEMTTLSHERSHRLRNSMHDLRGGVGIISGAAHLLNLEGLSEQEKTDYAGMLTRNLTSVQAMLTNLLDLSRLEAGKETLQLQPVDAAQLLKQIVTSIQPLTQERNLILRADGPSSLRVESDPVKLQRIIQNLLLNALKYTSTGFVDISWAEHDSQQWMFRIQDSGPGLPAQVVTLLTGHLRPGIPPFDRIEPEQPEPATLVAGAMDEQIADLALEQPANEPSKGEGIGLTIVKEFSQLLSARLEVEAVQGQGTCFRIWLPLRYPV